MDLVEKRTELSTAIEILENKAGEVVTVTYERESESAKVSDLESILRESSGTAAYMSELAYLPANRSVLIAQTATCRPEHESILVSL